MLLDFLDDVFLLHFALETPQCVFQRLTLLNNHFCHFVTSPQFRSERCLQSLALRALPTSIIACQAARGHPPRTAYCPCFYAVLRTLLRFMRTFYSIPLPLSSNLYDFSYFSDAMRFLIILSPTHWPPDYVCEGHLIEEMYAFTVVRLLLPTPLLAQNGPRR